ncbi:MAG: prolyl oligopeptidase family serine peptidase [Nanoarchaeota archaeon]|nr:prolyl oligopeptidase family serine peptidase [Nanoarchaeota archaeon]
MKKVFFIFPGITKYPFIWLTSLYAKIFLGMEISELSPEEHVKSINTPILFIHGTKDSQIPVEHSKILHKNAPNSQLWLVQGADHGMSYSNNPEEYKKRVMEFFDKHLLV